MNTTSNYYAWNTQRLMHLSVGAVVVNETGLILTVYLERVDGKYFLPTRTHKPGQSLEESVLSIGDKIGWKLNIVDFLGTTMGQFPVSEDSLVEKTVLWFKCTGVSAQPRDPQDRDADAEILWKSSEELEKIFAQQASISSDVDQRAVLRMVN